MLYTTIVNTVNTVIADLTPTDVKITIGCLLYSMLVTQENKIEQRKQALNFKEYYYAQVYDKKYTNRTIGYKKIETLITNKKIETLANVDNSDYKNILDYYASTDLEKKFNPSMLEPSVYGLDKFENKAVREKFRNLQDNYLTPLIRFYVNKYKGTINYTDLKIMKTTETAEPAKEIYIIIKGIGSDNILFDYDMGKIVFAKNPFLVELVEGMIHVII